MSEVTRRQVPPSRAKAAPPGLIPRRSVTSEEVKTARVRAGLTQRAAAAVIGYKVRTWQDWENNRRGMRRALLDLFEQRTK